MSAHAALTGKQRLSPVCRACDPPLLAFSPCRHAHSFNTAAGTTAAPPAGTAVSSAEANGWVLTGKLPAFPSAQLIGPMVRFGEFEPSTGTYELSVLVVSHPSLSSSTVQLHWGLNGPAMTAASSQTLDEIMG